MGLIADLKQLRLFLKVRSKFKEDSKMRGTLSAGYALASCVVVAMVAKATLACPDLTSKFVPALIAGVLGGYALYRKRPETAPKMKSAGAGAGVVAAIALVWDEVRKALAEVCGASFYEQLPTMLAAGAMVGLGLYLQSHKGGDDDKVSPGWKPPAAGAAAVVLLGLLTMGCASGQVRLGPDPRPLGVDLDTVQDKFCFESQQAAEDYVEGRGGKAPDKAEWIAKVRRKPCPPCPQGKQNCAASKANPTPTPAPGN